MKYLWHYTRLCSTRQQLSRSKHSGSYFEKHHIQPRSLGGSNDPENLVLLTPREHYIAHLLLYFYYKQLGGDSFRKMAFALVSMSAKRNGRLQRADLTARQYSTIREAAMNSSKGKKITNTSAYKKPKTAAHCEAIRKARLLAPPRSEETRKKNSLKQKGIIPPHNINRVTCPHCKKNGQEFAMKRWHFNNCKPNYHAQLA